MERFSEYDPFAWLYAHYWGREFHAAIVKVLDRVVLNDLPAGAALLDLCCGDGRLASVLHRRGFSVTGVDGSREMLAFARRRCPEVDFVLADARNFALSRRFDAALATFDSLNHVMSTKDLAQVFSRVRNCLRPGGAFVFDLNREEAYKDLWPQTAVTVDDAVVSVARGSYSPEERVARCEMTEMRLIDQSWRRRDFQLEQRCHSQQAVLRALRRAGFEAQAYPAGELGMAGAIGYGRDVYIATCRSVRSQGTARTSPAPSPRRGQERRVPQRGGLPPG